LIQGNGIAKELQNSLAFFLKRIILLPQSNIMNLEIIKCALEEYLTSLQNQLEEEEENLKFYKEESSKKDGKRRFISQIENSIVEVERELAQLSKLDWNTNINEAPQNIPILLQVKWNSITSNENGEIVPSIDTNVIIAKWWQESNVWLTWNGGMPYKSEDVIAWMLRPEPYKV